MLFFKEKRKENGMLFVDFFFFFNCFMGKSLKSTCLVFHTIIKSVATTIFVLPFNHKWVFLEPVMDLAIMNKCSFVQFF